MFKKAFITLICLFSALDTPAWAKEDILAKVEIRNVLTAKIAESYGPLWAIGDPKKLVDEFLADDAVVTASDSSMVWSGNTQNISLIAELMTSFPRINATPVWTQAVSDTVAYQFVKFELMPADKSKAPISAKSLYVWVKTKHGWRVAADHYSYSGMDKPTGVAE